MKILHPKVKALKLRAAPIVNSGGYVDTEGNLVADYKIYSSETDRTIKGYLAVWGIRDTHDTIFVKGCFAKSIRERGPESLAKQKIAHLWQHEVDNPTGQFTVLREDDYGLYFEAMLDDVPIGERELRQVRSGTLNQFSVGFNYIWDKIEYDEEQDALIIYEVELMEGSVCTIASNAETYAMRSVDQLEKDKETLVDETEDFIKSLPRSKQLELRQLLTKHISLAKLNKPDEKRTLDEIRKPKNEGLKFGAFNLNLNEFAK